MHRTARTKILPAPVVTTRHLNERTSSVATYLSRIADRPRTALVYQRRAIGGGFRWRTMSLSGTDRPFAAVQRFRLLSEVIAPWPGPSREEAFDTNEKSLASG
jgi:hypothetical protein